MAAASSADSSLVLQVVTTADAGGLQQTQASLSGVDAEVKALTASFGGLAAAAQAAQAAMTGGMAAGAGTGAGSSAVRDTGGGGRSLTLPPTGGGSGAGGGGSFPAAPPSLPAYPPGGGFGPAMPIPGNTGPAETQALLDAKKALAEANARLAAAEAAAAEAIRKGAGAAGQGAGASKVIIDAKDKTTKAEEEATRATEEGTEAQEEGSTTLVDATTLIVEATQKKKKAAEEGADADDKAAEGSDKVGRGAITAAQFLQDMQYGMGAVTNQLPQLLTGLGMGAGLAGGLSIVGVFLELAIKNLGLFEDEADGAGKAAKQTAAELHELYIEQRNAATSAAEQARHTSEVEDALKRQTKLVEDAAEAWQKLADGIDQAVKAKEAQNRSAIAETDAGLAAQLADIAADRDAGKITEGEAIQKSSQARRLAEEDKFQLDQRTMDDQRRALQEKAAVTTTKIGSDRDAAQTLGRNLQGVLSKQELASLEERITAAETAFKEAKQKLEEIPNQAVVSYSSVSTPGVLAPVWGPNPEKAKQQEEIDKQSKAFQALLKQRETNEEATKRAGVSDADEGWEKIKQLREQTDKDAADRDKLLSDADILTGQMGSGQRVYNQRRAQWDAEDRSARARLDQKQREEAQRREDRDLQEQRRKEDGGDRDMFERQRKSGVDVTDAQRDKARERDKARRAEDKARDEARAEETRKRLLPPDPQGPVMDAPAWQGPTISGLPGGPAAPPPPGDLPRQRRQAMDALSHVPPSADALREAADAAARSAERSGAAFESYHNGVRALFQQFQTVQERMADRISNLEGQLRESRYGR